MHGHHVIMEANAGAGISAGDDDYRKAGAEVVSAAAEVFARADMIVKVKEPQAIERKMLRENQVLFTYLHLAADRDQTGDLMDSGAVCIVYETVTAPSGGLPLLAPMSEVAGRLSIQAGGHCLERSAGGMGVLLGGVPGVAALMRVVILGAGVVGTNAAQMAVGTGAQVVVIDRSTDALRRIDAMFNGRAMTVSAIATTSNAKCCAQILLSAESCIGRCSAEADHEGHAAKNETRLGYCRRSD